jgi:ligand-binding sensor domain-containing protein
MIKIISLILLTLLLHSFSDAQVKSDFFLENAMITSITEEEAFIWVSTYGQGVFRFSKKDEKWQNYSTKNGKLENDLFYNIAASKDFVWAGSSEGLFIYDKKKDQWRKRKFAVGGEFGNWIRSLCYDPKQNVLWIGRFRNLTKLDVAKQRFSDHDLTRGSAKTNNITCIGLDGDSLVWFGSEEGIHFYNKKKDIDDKSAWNYIGNKDGFNEDGEAVAITDLIFEGGYVWIGTAEFITPEQPDFNIGGVYRFNRRLTWNRISKKNGLPANGIYCLARTGNKIWAGIYSFEKNTKKDFGKGLVLIDRFNGQITPIDLNLIESNSSSILALHFDNNFMWIGTEKGLHRVLINNSLAKWTGKKGKPDKKN